MLGPSRPLGAYHLHPASCLLVRCFALFTLYILTLLQVWQINVPLPAPRAARHRRDSAAVRALHSLCTRDALNNSKIVLLMRRARQTE